MSETIYIKLDYPLRAQSFELNNFIHKSAWEAFEKIIELKFKQAEEYNPLKNFHRYHNTITVNGERGAGKTSFLLTIQEYFNRNSEKYKQQIKVLPIIDPTLISTKQHVLLLIVTAIKNAVEKNLKDLEDENEKFEWQRSLYRLAKGLNQIDNIGSNPLQSEIWDDAGLVLERGLEISSAGLEFEKNFHIFVNKSLKILDKKALILLLDDIDTDFSKGWEILEVLRKYITTPQIIPVIAGNFNLYEMLVRENKWKLFDGLIRYEEDKKEILKRNIDELTQQYLMKILPPDNFINLHKFSYYLLYQNKYELKVKLSANQEKKEIKEFFKDIFESFYGYYYEIEYLETISNFPLRTVIHYLKAADEYYKLNEDKSITIDKKAFIQRCKDIFLTSLNKFEFNQEFFDIARGSYGIDYFTSLAIKYFTFDEVRDFKPKHSDTDKNIALIIIPQFFNLYLPRYRNFEWGIKFVMPFFLKKILKSRGNTNVEEFIKSYIDLYTDTASKIDKLAPQLINSKILFAQTYRRKELISLEEKDNESTFEKEKKGLEKDSLSLFFLTLPYIKGKKQTQEEDYFSPLYIIDFHYKLQSIKNIYNKNEIGEKILELIKTLLNKFQGDKKVVYLDEKLNRENTDESYEKDEEARETESSDYVEDKLKYYVEIVKSWLEIIDLENNREHLIEYNKAFVNFLERVDDKIKPSKYGTIKEYLAVNIIIYINELIAQKLRNKTVKQIVGFNTAIDNLIKNLENLKNEDKNYFEFIVKNYLLSPVFLPYIYNKKLDEKLKKCIEEEYININTQYLEYFKDKIKEGSLEKLIIIGGTKSKMPKSMFIEKFCELIKCDELKKSNGLSEIIKKIKEEYDKKKYKRGLPSDKEMEEYIKYCCNNNTNNNTNNATT